VSRIPALVYIAALEEERAPLDHDRLCIPPTSPVHKSEQEKKNQRTATSTDVAGRPACHRRSHHAIDPSAMSVLPKLDRHAAAA
jgi:hypothetical protein